MIKVYIEKDCLLPEAMQYMLELFSVNTGVQFEFIRENGHDAVSIGYSENASIKVSRPAHELINKGSFNHELFFKEDCIVKTQNHAHDYLTTAFYMINCLQEFGQNHDNFDSFGRFKYEKSYQHKFSMIRENLVQKCFDELSHSFPQMVNEKTTKKKSAVFISHDIDFLYEGMKAYGTQAIKAGRIDILARIIFKVCLGKPGWLNIDQIMKLNDEHDVKSVFFWLVNKGTDEQGIPNADYDIKKPRLQNLMKNIDAKGFENGLHKSSFPVSMNDELAKFRVPVNTNRYHFLKFQIPKAWDELSAAGIKADASLGFAENFGFRNSYGLPFQPFNLKENKPYPFLESNLHMMDATFEHYLKMPANQVASEMIGFMEKNKENCVFSILWHNNYFNPLNGYLNIYKKLLSYIKESKMKVYTTADMAREFCL